MGYAMVSSPCGCSRTRLMDPKEDIWITWIRCGAHYNPTEDDPMILQAAKNYREHLAAVTVDRQ